MDLLQEIKLRLRISADDFDSEIVSLIDAAKNDLVASGVKAEKVEALDALVVDAVAMFVKANFGLDNPDFAAYQNSYLMKVSKLKANTCEEGYGL